MHIGIQTTVWRWLVSLHMMRTLLMFAYGTLYLAGLLDGEI